MTPEEAFDALTEASRNTNKVVRGAILEEIDELVDPIEFEDESLPSDLDQDLPVQVAAVQIAVTYRLELGDNMLAAINSLYPPDSRRAVLEALVANAPAISTVRASHRED